jgi:hypothetical protein
MTDCPMSTYFCIHTNTPGTIMIFSTMTPYK